MSRASEIRKLELSLALAAGQEWRAHSEELQARAMMARAKGPKGADTASRVGKFVAREIERSRADPALLGIERRFGPTLDYEYIGPVESQVVSKTVARLVEVAPGGVAMSGFATGFMVSPRLLLTNWHVFQDASWAEGTYAQFGYQYMGALLQSGALFKILPSEFFHSNRDLDYALVAVEQEGAEGLPVSSAGFTRLIPEEGKILVGHSVNMIGHPDGNPKTFVFRNNPLIDLDKKCLLYLTDSDEGASGSPAYNPMWELVALHHRAVPKMDGERIVLKGNRGYWDLSMPTDDIEWLANEGIRVSALVDAFRTLQKATPHPLLAELTANAFDPIGKESGAHGGSMTDKTFDLPGVRTQMIFSGPVTINVGAAAAPVLGQALPAPALIPGAEAIIRFDPDYDLRPGYDPTFLDGFKVDLPHAAVERKNEMLLEDGDELVLKYHHYSLAMNKRRRLQMWSAVNVNYDEDTRRWFSDRKAFGTDKWIPDPRIPAKYQIMDPEAYAPSASLQRGHIVRRDDSAWGTGKKNQEFSNSDTFHWTNCTPQHGGFNQSSYAPGDGTRYQGIWGGLENKIAAVAQKADEAKLIVFAGPVLAEDDPTYTWGMGDVQIPMRYWKVVVAVEGGTLRSYGFILDQTKAFKDLGFERLNFGKFVENEVAIAELQGITGVVFDKQVLDSDVNS